MAVVTNISYGSSLYSYVLIIIIIINLLILLVYISGVNGITFVSLTRLGQICLIKSNKAKV